MIDDVLIAYAPLWYLAAAIVIAVVADRSAARWERRVQRARRSLSDIEIARAGRPSPAPIDVQPTTTSRRSAR